MEKAFESTITIVENAGDQSIPLFLNDFCPIVGRDHDSSNTDFVVCKSFDFIQSKDLTLYHTMTTFDAFRKKPYENILRKEENAGNHHFLLLPQRYLSDGRHVYVLITFVVYKCFHFGQDKNIVIW